MANLVGNKAKGWISKWVFQENKLPNFPKNKYFLPLIGTRTFVFQKIWHALFSWNTRFKICPFILLPTISVRCKLLGFHSKRKLENLHVLRNRKTELAQIHLQEVFLTNLEISDNHQTDIANYRMLTCSAYY